MKSSEYYTVIVLARRMYAVGSVGGREELQQFR